MATWAEVSADSRKAAQELLESGRFRSSISRSYYAAYAAIAGRLAARGVTFSHGRANPDHADLPAYVLRNLRSVRREARFRMNQAIRRLFKARVDADYVPEAALDRAVAVNAVRDARLVLRALGADDE